MLYFIHLFLKEYYEYSLEVFKFLDMNGIINFGKTDRTILKRNLLSKISKVIIIGAGISGLAAAQHLLSHNFDVEIIESKVFDLICLFKFSGQNRWANAKL